MTIRNLDRLLNPSSVALIGASRTPGSVGATVAHNLFNGGFDGPVMPVNPKHRAIEGVLAYPDVASLPVIPDLAVICTPPQAIPGLIGELGQRGTRAAVIVTAGFGEGGDAAGKALERDVLQAARPYLLRIVGPNCLGLIVPEVGLNASFAHLAPRHGHLAFAAQSGAIVTSVVDWAHSRGIGFSHLVSLGDMIDVDFGDMLDYLASDGDTRAILLYIEAVTHARKFLSAARAAARSKPVVVVKGGRHAEGAKAVASHTGALAGVDAVYDAAFRRAGMLRVFSLEELFDAVGILGMIRPPKGDRLAILSNGGGIGILATDALMDRRGRLAELSAATKAKLDAVLPKTWSHGNPVDIVGDADAKRYGDALTVLLESGDTDAVLVLNCPTAIASGIDAARGVVEAAAPRKTPVVIASWVGEASTAEARALFAAHAIPSYATPEAGVRAFMYTVNYRRSQELLTQTPPSIPQEFEPDVEAVRALVAGVIAQGREWLNEAEAKAALAAYGIPVAAVRIVATAEQAAAAAVEFGVPVAMKILSPDITHKSDVGGVALDLDGERMVRERAELMLANVRKRCPDARVEGFTVGPMVRRAGAYELIAGVTDDAQFGPVILFGHGGTAVEVVDDKALGLPPLNMHLAREIMSRTRIYRELEGYRDRAAADLDGIAMTLIKIAQLASDVPQVIELDINPLLADADGVIALDARLRVRATDARPGERLAIRPYPKELEEDIPLADGRELLLRPIVPEDEPALQDAFARFSPEQIRLRFFVPMKTLSHVVAARFTQIDYDREMALVLTEHGIAGQTELYGVVRVSADPDNERGEYAIIVRQDMTGLGLGLLLMRRIVDYARARGLAEIHGDVLHENSTMLRLCDALGFERSALADDPALVRVTLKLR
ncbi:MAG: bifunctional acetate--CoA ligase family protein/GNAT family N-acetyltransferase [Gammaproteobacteria bacterium]|nr:bifunctional acetate--CoA ligase family protein/GNAT family N-acetyltransferase [Gammaproteobacteria bacterium]